MRKVIKVALIVIVLLAISAGVYLVSRAGSSEYRAKAGKFEDVFIFLMPTEVKTSRGERFDLAVKIDTGKETVGGVEILIDFDPSLFKLAGNVRPGSVFPNLISEMGPGQISLRGEGRLIGQGTVATITFEGKAWGEGTVEVDEASVVWDEGITTNILGKTSGTRVMVE